MNENQFDEIYKIVRAIPKGRVMSYGQVGSLAGFTARTVGWAMTNVADDVPWQRVVGADGRLPIAKRSPILKMEQSEILESEGIKLRPDGSVDMAKYRFGVAESDTLMFDFEEGEEQP